jgi:hypothetical protein
MGNNRIETIDDVAHNDTALGGGGDDMCVGDDGDILGSCA